uniref:Uncharacterized protein n=1 Tax=Strongyloides stercoralis TaxID=6248 RepID=A0AAF5DIP6_STRER
FSNESLCLGTKVALSCYFNNNSFFNNWKFCDLTIDNIKIEIEKLMQNLTIAEKIQLVLKVNVLPTYKETLVQKFKAAEILQLGENGILISIVDFVGRITNKQTKKAPLTFKKMNDAENINNIKIENPLPIFMSTPISLDSKSSALLPTNSTNISIESNQVTSGLSNLSTCSTASQYDNAEKKNSLKLTIQSDSFDSQPTPVKCIEENKPIPKQTDTASKRLNYLQKTIKNFEKIEVIFISNSVMSSEFKLLGPYKKDFENDFENKKTDEKTRNLDYLINKI